MLPNCRSCCDLLTKWCTSMAPESITPSITRKTWPTDSTNSGWMMRWIPFHNVPIILTMTAQWEASLCSCILMERISKEEYPTASCAIHWPPHQAICERNISFKGGAYWCPHPLASQNETWHEVDILLRCSTIVLITYIFPHPVYRTMRSLLLLLHFDVYQIAKEECSTASCAIHRPPTWNEMRAQYIL